MTGWSVDPTYAEEGREEVTVYVSDVPLGVTAALGECNSSYVSCKVK